MVQLIAIISTAALAAAATLLTVAAAAATVGNRSPVVLVPGDGGSQLWVSLHKTNNHWYCEKSTSSPVLAWLQIEDLVYPAVNCLVYNIKLKYNAITGKTTDNDGVTVHTPGFGDTETVEWLSNIKIGPTGYYNKAVEHLVKNLGYTRGVDVHGAPFDFRKAPNELGDYFIQLKHLIESTFERNGRRRVVLVGHSLGCKMILHFLHTMPQAWKDRHVKSFVAAAGPFGGASSSLLAAISGYNLGLSFIKPLWVRESQRSWPSTYYLTPAAPTFNESMPIVSRPSRQYTLSKTDLQSLFKDIGYSQGYTQFKQLGNMTKEVQPPGVKTVCVFGYGVKTSRQFKWHSEADFPDKQPEIVYGDGDGTVNIASLDVCLGWGKKQKQKVSSVPVREAEHLKLLTKQKFVEAVADAASAPDA